MDFNEDMNQLNTLCKGQDWFYDIGTDVFGRVVVYVKYMNHKMLNAIPDKVAGKQVLVHFVGSKTATRDQFVETVQTSGFMQLLPNIIQAAREAQSKGFDVGVGQMLDEIEDEEQSLRHLQNELERLEKICGSNTLQDIFYEVQDGVNAVTNLSERHPEIRKAIEKLFDQYGFDVIYEELDG